MYKGHRDALQSLQTLTPEEIGEILTDIKNERGVVFVEWFSPKDLSDIARSVRVECVDMGVNIGERQGRSNVKKQNLEAFKIMKERLHSKMPNRYESPEKYAAVFDVLIPEIEKGLENPDNLGRNKYLTTVLYQVVNAIGDPDCQLTFGCKSGKDRTSMADAQVQMFFEQMQAHQKADLPLGDAIQKTIDDFQTLAEGENEGVKAFYESDDMQLLIASLQEDEISVDEYHTTKNKLASKTKDDETKRLLLLQDQCLKVWQENGSFELQAGTQGGAGAKLRGKEVEAAVFKNMLGIETKYTVWGSADKFGAA